MGGVSSKKPKKQVKIKNYVSWFEIPALNFDQAVNFYSQIFSIDMERISTNGYEMAFFPSDGGIGGAVISGAGSVPNDTGPLIYLNGGNDLNNVLGKVETAGGRIVMKKTPINDESGNFAIFLDTEGNKLALYSKK